MSPRPQPTKTKKRAIIPKVRRAVARVIEKRAIARRLKENRIAKGEQQAGKLPVKELQRRGSLKEWGGNFADNSVEQAATRGFERVTEEVAYDRRKEASRRNSARGKGKDSRYKLTGLGKKKIKKK